MTMLVGDFLDRCYREKTLALDGEAGFQVVLQQ